MRDRAGRITTEGVGGGGGVFKQTTLRRERDRDIGS